MKETTDGLFEITEEFCRAFCERFHANRKEVAYPQTLQELRKIWCDETLNISYEEMTPPLSAARQMLFILHILFSEQCPKWQVEELFAEFGPPARREAGNHRREVLAFAYGAEGKPPKLRFARIMAEKNAKLLARGCRQDELWGSGTTSVDTMHHYVKEMLKQEKCRKFADAGYDHWKENT